jgi:hypothetical protein
VESTLIRCAVPLYSATLHAWAKAAASWVAITQHCSAAVSPGPDPDPDPKKLVTRVAEPRHAA